MMQDFPEEPFRVLVAHYSHLILTRALCIVWVCKCQQHAQCCMLMSSLLCFPSPWKPGDLDCLRMGFTHRVISPSPAASYPECPATNYRFWINLVLPLARTRPHLIFPADTHTHTHSHRSGDKRAFMWWLWRADTLPGRLQLSRDPTRSTQVLRSVVCLLCSRPFNLPQALMFKHESSDLVYLAHYGSCFLLRVPFVESLKWMLLTLELREMRPCCDSVNSQLNKCHSR